MALSTAMRTSCVETVAYAHMDVGSKMCVRPRLYYDHASTFEELAEIFDHGFSRTTHRVDDQEGVPPQAVVGNARKCKSQCSGPPEFRKYQGEDVIARCEARCVDAGLRLKALREQPDAYLRDEWYRNWWLADTHADVGAVVEQITMHLGCDATPAWG
jgi:hypothetical protein